jgi:hypothetical protein
MRIAITAAAAFILSALGTGASADGLHEFGPWMQQRDAGRDHHHVLADDHFLRRDIPKRGTAVFVGPADISNPGNSGVTASINGGAPIRGYDTITLDFGRHIATSALNLLLLTPNSQFSLAGSGPLFAGNSRYVNRLTGQFSLLDGSASLTGGLQGAVAPGAQMTGGHFFASGTETFAGGAQPPQLLTVKGTFSARRQ